MERAGVWSVARAFSKTVVFGSGYVAARRAGADTGTRYIALHSAFGHSDMMQRDKESLARNSSVHRQRLWRVKGSKRP
jgi:hypothetical protein